MKGFIRILEAIIASIILIASLSYFFLPQSYQASWDDISSSVVVKDSIMAMEKSGKLAEYVRTNAVAALNSDLKEMMPTNIEFSAEVRDIANPIIYVQCGL